MNSPKKVNIEKKFKFKMLEENPNSDFDWIISNKPSGLKLTTNHGTNSFWVVKKPRLDILNQSKKITLIVNKGTKRIQHHIFTKPKEAKLTDNGARTVCNSCHKEIKKEIGKFLIMRNIDDNPQILSYHFFYPCWDFEKIIKQYSNLSLEKSGIIIPENLSISKCGMKELREKQEFWD